MPDARPTAIVADDEPRLAAYLVERLDALWPELAIAGIAANGPEALALIDAESPDVAFLDIRMPGLTGIEVARAAGRGVHVVFVTAHDNYAIEAFERDAVDYLLKPATDERLADAVARIKARLATGTPGPELVQTLEALARLVPGLATGNAGSGRLAWIRASVGAQVRLIPVDDVCYFQANDKYTSVFTPEGEALIRTPLKELGAQLDPDRFWQVHRGTIVNLAHVASTSRDLAGRVSISLRMRPEKVAVSRAFAHLFRQM
jgi:DNA-binding LytR/AlgR family response regulator